MKKMIEAGKLVLQPQEDLVASNVRNMVETVKQFIEEESGFEEVILNFEKVKIIDSIGISFVIGAYKTSLNKGKRFRVMDVNEDIVKLFKLMKLEEVFDI